MKRWGRANELALRYRYIAAGCDRFDWFGKGKTQIERKDSHLNQYNKVLGTLNNCWDKWIEMGWCKDCD